jgi:thiol-disulfide isomerase/thioredoxin
MPTVGFRTKWVLVGALVAVVGVVVAVGLANRPDDGEGIATGLTPGFERYAAPAITGTTFAGRPFDLTSLRGHPAVVNFWASWCGPCGREAPELVRFADEHAGRIAVVGVNVDDADAKARRFAREKKLQFPLVPASIDLVFEYGGAGLPHTAILDARGRVVDTVRGVVTAALLDSKLEALARES